MPQATPGRVTVKSYGEGHPIAPPSMSTVSPGCTADQLMVSRSLQAVDQLVPSPFDPLRETYQLVPDTGVGLGVGPGAGVADGDGAGVGVGVGVGVGIGVGVGLGEIGEATNTSCSTLTVCPRASVTVKRTYLVPTSWKVNVIVGPLPRFERSASSRQPYKHGVAKQTVAFPSKTTG